MPIRKAEATWKGNLKEGAGTVTAESGTIKDSTYTFSRFSGEPGTNPEELLGAAHASCFSMALSHGLATAGHNPKSVYTQDKVFLEKVAEGFSITKIEIDCEAEVPGLDNETFQKFAEDAKKGCPIAKALTGVKFVLSARLKS